MSIKNNIKDWITDLIGLGIWIVAIVMFIKKELVVWPDFIILLVVGAVFFLIPDEWLTGTLKKFITKKVENNDSKVPDSDSGNP